MRNLGGQLQPRRRQQSHKAGRFIGHADKYKLEIWVLKTVGNGLRKPALLYLLALWVYRCYVLLIIFARFRKNCLAFMSHG